MWTHQYDQMTNQVQCSRLPDGHVVFRTNPGNLTCSVLSRITDAAQQTSIRPGPNSRCRPTCVPRGRTCFDHTCSVGGAHKTLPAAPRLNVNLKPITRSKNVCSYTRLIQKSLSSLNFQFRIPAAAAAAYVDGAPAACGDFYRIKRVWSDRAALKLSLISSARVARPRGMACLWRASALSSLELCEEMEAV